MVRNLVNQTMNIIETLKDGNKASLIKCIKTIMFMIPLKPG